MARIYPLLAVHDLLGIVTFYLFRKKSWSFMDVQSPLLVDNLFRKKSWSFMDVQSPLLVDNHDLANNVPAMHGSLTNSFVAFT